MNSTLSFERNQLNLKNTGGERMEFILTSVIDKTSKNNLLHLNSTQSQQGQKQFDYSNRIQPTSGTNQSDVISTESKATSNMQNTSNEQPFLTLHKPQILHNLQNQFQNQQQQLLFNSNSDQNLLPLNQSQQQILKQQQTLQQQSEQLVDMKLKEPFIEAEQKVLKLKQDFARQLALLRSNPSTNNPSTINLKISEMVQT